jgi:hypothetical protein
VRRVNLSQKDVCVKTLCIKKEMQLIFDYEAQKFLKPEKCIKIYKLLYNGQRLKGATDDELDAAAFNGQIPKNWREGTNLALFYIQDFKHIEIAPRPADLENARVKAAFFSWAKDLTPGAESFDGVDYLREFSQVLVDAVVYKCLLEDQNQFYAQYKTDYNDGLSAMLRAFRQEDNWESFSILGAGRQ